MSENVKHRGPTRPPEVRVAEVIRQLKTGKMPDYRSRLAKLIKDTEEGIYHDFAGKLTTVQAIRVGLLIQCMVLVAGLPLWNKGKTDINAAYKWAVDNIREILAELERKPSNAKKPKAKVDQVDLESLIYGEED